MQEENCILCCFKRCAIARAVAHIRHRVRRAWTDIQRRPNGSDLSKSIWNIRRTLAKSQDGGEAASKVAGADEHLAIQPFPNPFGLSLSKPCIVKKGSRWPLAALRLDRLRTNGMWGGASIS